MVASVTTLTILDGNGASRTVQVLDLSGTGAGPFSFMNNMVDGAGVNLLSINSAGAASVALTTGSASIGTVTVTQNTASNLNATVVGTGTFATQTVLTTGTASIGTVTAAQPTAASLNATVVGTGTFATQTVLTTGAATIGTATVTQATASNLNATVVGTGTFVTQTVLTTGAATIGTVTAAQPTAASLNATVVGTGTFTTQSTLTPATTGGLSAHSFIVTTGSVAQAVKASAGQLYSVLATNNSATIAYLKFYNSTTATAGANTPVVRVMIPANSTGAGIVMAEDTGIAFSTGISYTVTGGIADNDTTSCAASTYLVNVFYK